MNTTFQVSDEKNKKMKQVKPLAPRKQRAFSE